MTHNIYKGLKLIVLCLFILSSTHIVTSQNNYWFQTSDPEFNNALQLFQNKKYGSARLAFEAFGNTHKNSVTTLRSEAAYFEARSAQLLTNNDAIVLFERYLIDYPESRKLDYVYFHIGEMLQEESKFKQANKQYEKVNSNGLDAKTRLDYAFKRGYCLFMEEEYDQALNWFAKVKGTDSPYAQTTNYYYSHIQYQKGKYDVALKGFLDLVNDPVYAKIVPFYIAQIYYLQKDYDKAIAYATPLLDLGTNSRKADMNRIIGNAHFAKKQYANAIPFLEKSIVLSTKPLREDYYNLGFAYYYTSNYIKAAENLSKVTSDNDLMTQNAYYHLGDCYLKLKDKKRARVAFDAASKEDYDKQIQEDALLNCIKLNYEMGYAPFNEIINSFLSFIQKFPNSTKIDQAYDYLGKAFLTTKNYKQALETMANIKSKDATVYRAMQRIAYYRGLELFTSLQFTEAIDFFTQSLKYGEYDKELKVKAYYWRAESWYRLARFDNATADYNQFILSPSSYKLLEFKTAHYNMGYLNFNDKKYTEAADWFEKYLKLAGNEKSPMVADANNRVADCYFVDRNFANAIRYFDKTIAMNSGMVEYAMFQKAFCLGLMKKQNEKLTLLKELIAKYPNSNYVDDAYYEMGKSHVALNELPNALQAYKTVYEKYPQSSNSTKALLQLGLVNYNSGNLDNSMTYYKKVVADFPGTPEAQDALIGIRNIYMDRGDAEGYFKYTNTLGSFAKTDLQEQDSLVFEVAQKHYQNDDCGKAVPLFENYLKSFSDGRYAMDAHYYKADCQYRTQLLNEAVKSYEVLANMPRNSYSEEALQRCGEIYFLQKNYDLAIKYFSLLDEMAETDENKLEARIGLMRCQVILGNAEAIVLTASRVLWSPKLAPEIEREARFAKAKALISQGNKVGALTDLKILSSNTMSKEGAEAKYLLVQYYFDDNKHDLAEKEVFSYADMGTSHQYWLARSFIVLSDIYALRGENFQAEQYLQSLLDNYKVKDDIHVMANERIAKLKQ